MGVITELSLPSAARATYTSGPLPTNTGWGIINVIDVDITVSAFTGGASPTVTFRISRVGADGLLYTLWQPVAISAAGVFTQSIGTGAQTNEDLGDTFQVDQVTTGAPTSVTWSGGIKARTS